MNKNYILLFSVILFSVTININAQESYTNQKVKFQKEKTIPFSDRWSIRTNAIDWITTVPNVAVEFDISDSVYNRWALGAGLKFNYIPSSTDFAARFTYKIAEARLEARRYFRSYQLFPYRSGNRKRNHKGWWRPHSRRGAHGDGSSENIRPVLRRVEEPAEPVRGGASRH